MPAPSKTSAAAAAADRIHRPRTWITLWLVLSSLLVIWDSGYILLRPRSMKGGSLSWIWRPYELYGRIDKNYGIDAWNAREGFPTAQAQMNIPETILNFAYLYIVYFTTSPHARVVAPLIGFTATVMTAAKTVLYILVEIDCGFCKTRQDSWLEFITLYIMPNTPWIYVPTAIAVTLGLEITAKLNAAAGLSGKTAAVVKAKSG